MPYNPARAVTNDRGRNISGLSNGSYDLRADRVPMNATRDHKYEPEPRNIKTCKFGDILSDDRLGRLAHYIRDKRNTSLRAECEYEVRGNIKWIRIEGETYWARGYNIHDNNKGDKYHLNRGKK